MNRDYDRPIFGEIVLTNVGGVCVLQVPVVLPAPVNNIDLRLIIEDEGHETCVLPQLPPPKRSRRVTLFEE